MHREIGCVSPLARLKQYYVTILSMYLMYIGTEWCGKRIGAWVYIHLPLLGLVDSELCGHEQM